MCIIDSLSVCHSFNRIKDFAKRKEGGSLMAKTFLVVDDSAAIRQLVSLTVKAPATKC